MFAVGDIYFAGIAADVAGAVILALGFSFKKPERMREEVPQFVQAPNTPGHVTLPFPQAQLESMVRQRAEARWGMALLVAGFALQAVSYLAVSGWRLHGRDEKLGALVIVAAIWLVAYIGWVAYVPTTAWLTIRRIPAETGPVGLYDGRQLEMRGGRQIDIAEAMPPPIVARVLMRLSRQREG